MREVERAGRDLSLNSALFSSSPLEPEVRAAMLEAARSLLSAVTKLLLMADHVDLSKILRSVAETGQRLGQLEGRRPSPGAVREVERAVLEAEWRSAEVRQSLWAGNRRGIIIFLTSAPLIDPFPA